MLLCSDYKRKNKKRGQNTYNVQKKQPFFTFEKRVGNNGLIMTLGYDRIYKTLLPIKVSNTIQGVTETVNIKGKTFKNCIQVMSEGKTSYNPGPPLDVINIEIKQKQWYCPKYGLIKMVREESSDSETMGNIFYEKKIRL